MARKPGSSTHETAGAAPCSATIGTQPMSIHFSVPASRTSPRTLILARSSRKAALWACGSTNIPRNVNGCMTAACSPHWNADVPQTSRSPIPAVPASCYSDRPLRYGEFQSAGAAPLIPFPNIYAGTGYCRIAGYYQDLLRYWAGSESKCQKSLLRTSLSPEPGGQKHWDRTEKR